VRVLLLDNYDSFTFNLFHYLEANGVEVEVYRNDEISVQAALSFDAIILSPGPGLPKDAGIMPQLLQQISGDTPVLGVCLGLQAIVESFGGTLKNLNDVLHGQATSAHLVGDDDTLFKNISSPFQVGHYHSWAADLIGDDLEVTAINDDGVVMAIKHKSRPISAVQFHPESVLTPCGMQMITNWCESIKQTIFSKTYEKNY
jgi:anthranilate synthase component 2